MTGGWIKLEPGSWPDHDQDCLFVLPDGVIVIGVFRRLGDGLCDFSYAPERPWDGRPILWQPLPELPEEFR